jgi:hypothetical protein
MLSNRSILGFGIFITVFTSCIEPYTPNLGGNADKYVVYGQVTDQEGYQTVSVSTASSVENPTYHPLSGCTVKIINNHGDEFLLTESEKGNYQVWIGHEYLTPRDSFKIDVIAPTGIEIVSDFDQMPENPGIDSIYYIRKDVATTNPDKPLQGIQFYVDMDGKNTNSIYYRYELTETWEHHAVYPVTLFWNKVHLIEFNPPDSSRFFCWTTLRLRNIFTLSTEGLTQNRFKMYPLHFVDNNTQRLTYGYSLLINQFALSEPAYKYWNNLRINSNEDVGLYEIQPVQIKGNLRSTTNSDLEVLGFFGAASVRSKRIFVQNVPNLDLFYPQCDLLVLQPRELGPKIMKYLILVNGQIYHIEDACVECNIFGGLTVKPDFWPN